jgi:hypothetical protein
LRVVDIESPLLIDLSYTRKTRNSSGQDCSVAKERPRCIQRLFLVIATDKEPR